MAWLKFHDLTFVVNRESERLVAVAVLPGQGCLTLNTQQRTWERGMVGISLVYRVNSC